MGKKARKKLRHAYDFISDAIARGEFAGPGFFPSARSLAAIAGVSATTVRQAIELLKNEGRLAGARGHRAILPGRIPGKPPRPTGAGRPMRVRKSKSLAIQGQIERDILNGRFRHGALLPSVKELAGHYGISPATVRKALLALTEQSILRHSGAGYSPQSIAGHGRFGQRIVLLGFGNNLGRSITWGYWHQENFKLLEVECARSRISLDVVCFERLDGELRTIDARTWKPFDITNTADLAGYIYLVTGPESVDDDLLRSVAGACRPVAVFDEMGTWPPPVFLKRHPNIRIFRNTVSDQPALHVARFVLELGHRAAVFISPDGRLEYSRRRLDGLLTAFSRIEGARLVPIVMDQIQAISRLDVQDAADFYAGWTKGLAYSYTAPIEEHLGLLRFVIDSGALRDGLYPLLHQALKHEDATVWIAVNDTCADAAFDFLKQRDIPVPERISIISFDDLPVAVNKGVSSYNFNHPAAMVAMLRFITNPRLLPVSRPVIEIEGWVVPRRTTGKPPKRR